MSEYDLNQAAPYAGMKSDSRFDEVKSYAAEEEIQFGYAVGAEAGNVESVSLIRKDNAKLVFDADFVADNAINGKVNTVSWVEVDFDTDHDTTAAALVVAIGNLAGVTCVLDPADANNRTFLIEAEGTTIAVTDVAVTGGASQAGSTVTLSGDNLFRGIALSTHNENGKYLATDTVSVLTKGQAHVEVSAAVTADADAYVDTATSKFTSASSGNIQTGGKFRSTTAGAGIAEVEINLPNF